MACSLDVQPEFVPTSFCSDYDCDQLANFLVNETALDELWRAQGLPTPPTTPERVYTPSSDMNSESENEELPLLSEIILLAYGEEALISNPLPLPPLTTATDLQDNLIQDCMWSGHICNRASSSTTTKKPSNAVSPSPLPLVPSKPPLPGDQHDDGSGGDYTPAPSPPPPSSSTTGGDSSQDEESDCVSPSAVFPALLAPPDNDKAAVLELGSKNDRRLSSVAVDMPATPPKRKRVLDPDWEQDSSEECSGRHGYERSHRRKRKLSTAAVGTGGNARHQPQSDMTTSDEEIDVVTVPSSERTKVNRKRSQPLSAPCSRQNSPHPPPKRKKYHTKRLQRLSSAGSSVGEAIESDDEARRASHNVLERKRRNDLKSSFQCLREEIPELEDNHRAPKVTILRKAMEYIQRMQEVEQTEEAELVAEQQRKTQLLDRLSKLRSDRI